MTENQSYQSSCDIQDRGYYDHHSHMAQEFLGSEEWPSVMERLRAREVLGEASASGHQEDCIPFRPHCLSVKRTRTLLKMKFQFELVSVWHLIPDSAVSGWPSALSKPIASKAARWSEWYFATTKKPLWGAYLRPKTAGSGSNPWPALAEWVLDSVI